MRNRGNNGATIYPAVILLLLVCLAGCSKRYEYVEPAEPAKQSEAATAAEPASGMRRITILTGSGTSGEHPKSYAVQAGLMAEPEDPSADGSGNPPAGVESAGALINISPGSIVAPETVEEVGVDAMFWQTPLDDDTFARINGKSYREGCPVSREDLRYMQMLHYDLEGNIRVGEMISNYRITDVLLSIFRQLYDAHYPIEKMVLVDEYDANDEASSMANNTSCFNFRTVANTHSLSYHASGLAVNINPLYNPYVISGYGTGGEIICTPVDGVNYLDRDQDFPYKISEDDLCVRLFKEAGFTWGGDWSHTPDYMHFDCRGAGY